MELDWKRSGQDKALEFTDGNMLVSASAGSGKTTVMVEKIRRYLTRGGSLKRLVVVTFTRASAEDMKEKIELELKELIRRTGDERYKAELRALPIAYIGTVDSLCSAVYKKYFEEAGGPPSFKMLEEDEKEELLREASDAVLQEKLASGDAAFERFIHYYAGLDPSAGFYSTVRTVFDYLDTRRDPGEFFGTALKNAALPFDERPAVRYLVDAFRGKLQALLGEIGYWYHRTELCPPKRTEALKSLLSGLETTLAPLAGSGVRELFERLEGVDLPRKPSVHASYKGEERAHFEAVAGYIDRVNSAVKDAKTLFTDYETSKSDDDAVEKDARTVLESVKSVAEVYYELKLKEGAFDFSDVERLALKILSDPVRAKEFREEIDYIFFDEYQDVNPLQEAIIAAISRDNVFMVGDVKQSVYRFRHAEPKLFLKRYGEYADGKKGKNVPLNMNFRSAQPILDFSDRLFSKIMTPAFGGVDYDSEARFNEAGLDIPPLSFRSVAVRLFDKPASEEKEFPPFYTVAEGESASEEADPEAEFVADDILGSVGREEIPCKGGFRKLCFSDIAVLVRDKNVAARFAKEFDKRGIPYDSESAALADTGDVEQLTAFLKIIDNPFQDYPLAAAMTSTGGGFTESELYELARTGEGEFFYERALSAKASPVKEKFDNFMNEIARYRKLSHAASVPALINAIASERGFIRAMASSPKRLQFYNSFLKHISLREYAADLGRFLKRVGEGSVFPGGSATGTGVNILTIHKSKGLEFPSVYVTAVDKNFKFNERRAAVVPDGELGLGLKVFDDELRTAARTLSGIAIERKTTFESKQEEARLAYVAVTRARYRLRVTGYNKKDFKTYPEEATSVLDWLKQAAEEDAVLNGLIESGVYESRPTTGTESGDEKEASSEPVVTFFEYPYALATKVANKYTVTALNAADESERDELECQHTPSLDTQDAEKGILYHKIMEKVDLTSDSEEAACRELERLKAEGIDTLDMTAKALSEILSLPVFDGIEGAEVLREKPFIYSLPARKVLETDCSDNILVQGVIDLAILGKETVLVDYKVSGASEKTLKARYAKQMELYSEALYEATGRYPDRRYIVLLNRKRAIEM